MLRGSHLLNIEVLCFCSFTLLILPAMNFDGTFS